MKEIITYTCIGSGGGGGGGGSTNTKERGGWVSHFVEIVVYSIIYFFAITHFGGWVILPMMAMIIASAIMIRCCGARLSAQGRIRRLIILIMRNNMHYILILGLLTTHYPSLASCEASRQGYMQSGQQVSECIDKTLIPPVGYKLKPTASIKAFKQGWKEEMAKPEIEEGQDI
jgi:hypothetical protein